MTQHHQGEAVVGGMPLRRLLLGDAASLHRGQIGDQRRRRRPQPHNKDPAGELTRVYLPWTLLETGIVGASTRFTFR